MSVPRYFVRVFPSVLMHFAQATVFLPEGKVTDWRFGYCFRLAVGLYLVALKRTRRQTTLPRLPQIAHSFAMVRLTINETHLS